MNETMKYLMNERLRLVQIRKGLTEAVTNNAYCNVDSIPFFKAASNYIQQAMRRLHDQDILMLEMIKKKSAAENIDAEKAITEAYNRLDGNQKLLTEFSEKTNNLTENSLASFQEISQRYSDYILQNMGHHAPSANLARQLFSEQDWLVMANISEESEQKEKELFNKAVELAAGEIRKIIETKPEIGRPTT